MSWRFHATLKGMRGKQGDALELDGDTALPYVVTAAHELKSPLALIRQLGLGLNDGDLSDAQERLVSQNALSRGHALRLTSDLSRASRMQEALFDLEPIQSKQLCEEVAHELAPLYTAKQRSIMVPGERSRLILANRELLRRILLNFGDNALHYAETNEPVEIQVSHKTHGESVRLGVRDFGPAIPADAWRRLSASLGKQTQALPARPQSSGLGLYIASQFAGAMNARVGATRHNNGATFYVDVTASRQLNLL